MKKKQLYHSPEASEFRVNLESAMLATSNVDFENGNIDGAIEDTWIITEMPSIF